MLRNSFMTGAAAIMGAGIFLSACGGESAYIDPQGAEAADEAVETWVEVSGQVRSGTNCSLLTGGDGTVYALAGATNISEGGWYDVTGREVNDSVCREGDIAVSVSTAEPVESPQNAIVPEDALITGDHVEGAWTHRGGDCARPDFDITGIPGGGWAIETSLDGAPRTGTVRLGDAPAFTFDQPERELPLEMRRAEALAVLPPEDGEVRLGGETIAGDGVVFVKCSERLSGE